MEPVANLPRRERVGYRLWGLGSAAPRVSLCVHTFLLGKDITRYYPGLPWKSDVSKTSARMSAKRVGNSDSCGGS